MVRATVNTYMTPVATAGSGGETVADEALAYWHTGAAGHLRAPKRSGVFKSDGTTMAATEYHYTGEFARPSAVEQYRWNGTKGAVSDPLGTGNSVVSRTVYDGYGNVTDSYDGRGVQTHINYDGNSLYPTERMVAVGRSEQRTTTYEFEGHSGVLSSEADDNSIKKIYTYDVVKRLTGTVEEKMDSGDPPQPVITRNASVTYDDVNRTITKLRDFSGSGDCGLEEVDRYDELGRLSGTTRKAAAGEDLRWTGSMPMVPVPGTSWYRILMMETASAAG